VTGQSRDSRGAESAAPGAAHTAQGASGPADYARACIEQLVRGRPVPQAPSQPLFATRSACFVSLKKRGQLRGCIGTLEPAEPTLGAEIARNARSAAFHDPRFHRLREDELADLECSVDVLSTSEVCALADLAPERYGVIVACDYRRGVLLPELDGVDTVGQQVGIALQKAGIDVDECYEIERFTVQRFHEGDTCDDGTCVGAGDEASA
jgi:AmmeMemoRadiSam system protein A